MKGHDRTLAELNFSTEQVDVSLPRFRAEFTTELCRRGSGFVLPRRQARLFALANAKLTSMRRAPCRR